MPVYVDEHGTVTKLTVPSGTDYIASDMTASGTDLYFTGSADQQPDDASGTPVYWKNGVLSTLPLPGGVANGSGDYIVVSGADVYIAGDEVDAERLYSSSDPLIPLYWKNGQLVSLPLPAGDANARVDGLEVSGSDVYAAGVSGTTNGNNGDGSINGSFPSHAVYWKNGNLNLLPTTGIAYAGVIGMTVAPY